MNLLEARNKSLKAEADKILHERGLLKILEKFGETFVTGSYTLGLMMRRDLDINIANDNITVKTFFEMGGEIAAAMKPARILYIDEHVFRHQRLPLGYYLGVNMGRIEDPEQWKIDIWSMDKKQFNKNKQKITELKSAISSDKRKLILEIKNKSLGHPWYQHNFFSMDIYDAVLYSNIKTADEFFNWVKLNKSADTSI